MCGICGIVKNNKQDVQESTLRSMNDAIIHRGPDDQGYWTGDGCGLAMRRLSIIDVAGGHQPITNEDGTIWVVFNGEIYNFKSIRDELTSKGHIFKTCSDTEVLVHLYEELGENMASKLNGIFAFALWDRKKQQLMLVRDRVGVKPLHYSLTSEGLIFASEIKAILKNPSIRKSLDLISFNQYLTYEYIPAPRTIYAGIKKLMPGHMLIYKNGEVEEKEYWRLSFNKPDSKNLRLPEILENIEFLIADSISLQKISDVPLGVFLSGGVDSSLITYFLSKITKQKIQTFNVGFSEASFDESNYAKNVAKYLGTDHHELMFTPQHALETINDVSQLLDEPLADGSLIATHFLSKFTKQNVTVALSGDGGDELFGGYITYIAHQIARFIPKGLGPSLYNLSKLLPVSDENISFDFKIKRFSAGLAYDVPQRHQVWMGSFDPSEKTSLLSNNMLELMQHPNLKDIENITFEPIVKALNNFDGDDYMNRILYQDMLFYLGNNMFYKVDQASMNNSLEVRVPLLDHRLIEYVCSLPGNLKVKGLDLKYLLKTVTRKYLPENIVNYKKKGFGIPMAKWLKGPLMDMGNHYFDTERIKKAGIFNPKTVNNLWQDHLSNKADNRKYLWTLLVFEMWCDNYGFDDWLL